MAFGALALWRRHALALALLPLWAFAVLLPTQHLPAARAAFYGRFCFDALPGLGLVAALGFVRGLTSSGRSSCAGGGNRRPTPCTANASGEQPAIRSSTTPKPARTARSEAAASTSTPNATSSPAARNMATTTFGAPSLASRLTTRLRLATRRFARIAGPPLRTRGAQGRRRPTTPRARPAPRSRSPALRVAAAAPGRAARGWCG